MNFAANRKAQYDLTEPVEGAGWSGTGAIPKIGDTVNIHFNKLGDAVVEAYFVQYGVRDPFLGVQVRLLDPPEWWLRQNTGVWYVRVFGNELR